MRQCLYNACIHQQPPNVDFSLNLLPILPAASDPIGDLRSETSWANFMTWICSMIVQFCFGGSGSGSVEPSARRERWRELKDKVDSWARERPRSFDPIWESEGTRSEGENPFPNILFTADWHGMFLPFISVNSLEANLGDSSCLWLLPSLSYPTHHLRANASLRNPQSPLRQAPGHRCNPPPDRSDH